jgi:general secretion pathway protein L
MKIAESSIARAWRQRALKRAPAPAAGERLDLILPMGWPETTEPVQWRWQRRGEVQSGEVHELARLPEAARRVPAHVWTPAAETVLTQVTLPTRSRRKIMQALPYALEDRLVGDPETLHFAWRPEADGGLSVAVTARARVDTWLERLEQAGIRPLALCPATLLVPWALDSWSLAFVGGDVLVRSGAVAGFVCPAAQERVPALLVAAAQEARAQPNPPEALVIFHAPPGLKPEAWSEALGLPVRVEPGSLWDKQTDSAAPLNLMQGQFEPATQVNANLRPYLPALILLGLWLASSLAFDVSDWWRLKRQRAALTAEMTSILKASFPETKTVLDPAAQMQKSVDLLLARRGKGEREMLGLLAKVPGALRGTPRMRLRGLRYTDQSLTLELTWPATATPDAFKAALESAGLRTEVLALTPRANEVDGRLRLQPAAGARSGS